MDPTSQANIDLTFSRSSSARGKFLVIDTETTGLPPVSASGETDFADFPKVVQVAWLLFDERGGLVESHNRYLLQEKPVPVKSTRIHGIDDAALMKRGEHPEAVWADFIQAVENCEYIVAHAIAFDLPVLEAELSRSGIHNSFAGKKKICTMKLGREIARIPAEDGANYRVPTLEELYKITFLGHLSDKPITGLHDAYTDAAIAARIFFRLLEEGQISLSDAPEEPFKLPPVTTSGPEIRGRFFLKIILPTLMTILFFIMMIFLIIIPRFKENIMVGKREMIRELTNAAASILEKYERDEKAGLLTREEAQNTAIARIQYLRYGSENKDYFWITDTRPFMIVHPYRSDLNGKSMAGFTDPHGKRLFVEMAEVCRKSGQGYVEYMWQWKDDTSHIVPKLSYVRMFSSWGWIIGTGIYLEDVRNEMVSLTRRLLLISIGITLVIALLLTYISLQSLRIENKRKKAEEELHASREKYKSLVEASNEGLVMVLDGKMVFVNNRCLEMTGFAEEELVNQSLPKLISRLNDVDVLKYNLSRDIPEGQFMVLLTSSSGEPIETIASVSTIRFMEKKGKLLTFRDASIQRHPEGLPEKLQQLLGNAGIGYIRFTPDAKGRLSYASLTAQAILGLHDVTSPSPYSILDFFADSHEKRKYRKELFAHGRIREAVIQLRRGDSRTAMVSVSMILSRSESGQSQGEGLIRDISENAAAMENDFARSVQWHGRSAFLDAPAAHYAGPCITAPPDTPLARLIAMMKSHMTDAVLIVGKEEQSLGIVTLSDVAEQVLLHGADPMQAAYTLMHAPLISASNDVTLRQAVNLMITHQISHLPVAAPAGGVSGILSQSELFMPVVNSFSLIDSRIEQETNIDGLIKVYNDFRQYAVHMIRLKLPPVMIGDNIAQISDKVTSKLISLAIESFGEPPADFAFVALGSEGRMEQTLATDQDNAIIFGDVDDATMEKAQQWFNRLGEFVCDHLNSIGFRYCKGRMMAKNPLWCKPLQTWKEYFSKWISNTEPRSMMEISIFFDFRCVYGNPLLTEALRSHIHKLTSGNGSFFYNLADSVISFRSPLGITGNIHTDKIEDRDGIDLKGAVTPFVMFARIYSIREKVDATGSIQRLHVLRSGGHLPSALVDELILAYHVIMQLRFRHQSECILRKKEPDNFIPLDDLGDLEESMLKKSLQLVPVLQSKLKTEFKSMVL